MAKIARKTSKLFGSTAGGSDIGVFGSLAAGSPAYSTDPAVIQSLSNFLTGWAAETIATRRPAYQDFNALDFLTFYQLGYLFQSGIPEWDAGTNYFTGSICAAVGTGILYRSLTDNNLNNAVTDASKWEAVVNIPSTATLVNSMGNVSGSISPVIDKVNVAVLTGSVTLALPTPTTGELHNLVFEFTMGSAYTVTISGVTWNYGAAPGLDATGKKNRIVLDTINGGSTWKGCYSQF